MTEFKTGQKWISSTEPDLGMGTVTGVEQRTVSIRFDLAGESRTYTRQSSPLTRVKFNRGDRIATTDDIVITVSHVSEIDGILIYHGKYQGTETAIQELNLDPNVRFSKPQDRLFTHQLDDNRWFSLRYQTLRMLDHMARAKTRGLYGPRVSLVPHQLYIGNEVASRYSPRVLLADEVGLGKTIEAGLILHHQLQTGRAERVLVIVPQALTFQWFVELIRRFNLAFTILDEERCQNIVADNSPDQQDEETISGIFNPFEAQQLVLCSLSLFTDYSIRLEQAIEARWDLIVVDEAHHLTWEPGNASQAYLCIEQLSAATSGLLLLTATPEQLGIEGHFARLRLLDPSRYLNINDYRQEENQFTDIVGEVRKLREGSAAEKDTARKLISERLSMQMEGHSDNDLIDAVLDQHGTGRVLFRNVRSSIEGFPKRLTYTYPLVCTNVSLLDSAFPEDNFADWPDADPRLPWLVKQLENLSPEKVLLICHRQATVLGIADYLAKHTPIRTAVFHQGMDLIARDKAANYFAETEKGAQVLLCSEIGSEGRNFQFASHIIMFDLPASPDLLEQRIGRLDRIGQKSEVKIHIPFIEGSLTERLYRWFSEGFDLFHGPNAVAQSIFDELKASFDTEDIDDCIAVTQTRNLEKLQTLQHGRDQLLELNSHRPHVSQQLVADVVANEGGKLLADYMELSFEAFGLESEYLGGDVHLVKPGDTMARHYSVSLETQDHYHYPELPEDGIRYTYDRNTALAREDVAFFTWENPLVQQALDKVTFETQGNSSMVVIKHPELKTGTLLLEALFVAECVAPRQLMVSRYLPPKVIRQLISPSLTDLSYQLDFDDFEEVRIDVGQATLHQILDSQIEGIRKMLQKAESNARMTLGQIIEESESRALKQLDAEIARLEHLSSVNGAIRPVEVEHLRSTRDLLQVAITQADIRLDAVRLIVCA